MCGLPTRAHRPLALSLLRDADRCQLSAAGVAPAARSAHVAAAYKGRYLIVFGGGSVAHCFNDLHVLDTETMEWSQPPVEGDQPRARAGESCCSVQLPTPAAHTTCPCRRSTWSPGASQSPWGLRPPLLLCRQEIRAPGPTRIVCLHVLAIVRSSTVSAAHPAAPFSSDYVVPMRAWRHTWSEA